MEIDARWICKQNINLYVYTYTNFTYQVELYRYTMTHVLRSFLSLIIFGRAPDCICIVHQLVYIVLYWTPGYETSLMQ